jgi:secondary thiamine-phosphate synthase enzyme
VGSETRGSQLKQFTKQISIATHGKGLYAFGRQVEPWVEESALQTGLLTVFVQHTSASLVIQENADPDVVRDLNDFFARLAPEDQRLYRHTVEGPDDMPAHIRAALTQTHLAIPVHQGRLGLGTWQGIYLFEHRAANHRRNVLLHLIGE